MRSSPIYARMALGGIKECPLLERKLVISISKDKDNHIPVATKAVSTFFAAFLENKKVLGELHDIYRWITCHHNTENFHDETETYMGHICDTELEQLHSFLMTFVDKKKRIYICFIYSTMEFAHEH